MYLVSSGTVVQPSEQRKAPSSARSLRQIFVPREGDEDTVTTDGIPEFEGLPGKGIGVSGFRSRFRGQVPGHYCCVVVGVLRSILLHRPFREPFLIASLICLFVPIVVMTIIVIVVAGVAHDADFSIPLWGLSAPSSP